MSSSKVAPPASSASATTTVASARIKNTPDGATTTPVMRASSTQVLAVPKATTTPANGLTDASAPAGRKAPTASTPVMKAPSAPALAACKTTTTRVAGKLEASASGAPKAPTTPALTSVVGASGASAPVASKAPSTPALTSVVGASGTKALGAFGALNALILAVKAPSTLASGASKISPPPPPPHPLPLSHTVRTAPVNDTVNNLSSTERTSGDAKTDVVPPTELVVASPKPKQVRSGARGESGANAASRRSRSATRRSQSRSRATDRKVGTTNQDYILIEDRKDAAKGRVGKFATDVKALVTHSDFVYNSSLVSVVPLTAGMIPRAAARALEQPESHRIDALTAFSGRVRYVAAKTLESAGISDELVKTAVAVACAYKCSVEFATIVFGTSLPDEVAEILAILSGKRVHHGGPAKQSRKPTAAAGGGVVVAARGRQGPTPSSSSGSGSTESSAAGSNLTK